MSLNNEKRRIDTDIIKLIENKHEVTIMGGLNEFSVKFHGPHGTPYEGGVWQVRVHLPENYPFKPPTIVFINQVYHPNINIISGRVCLDVINQTWTPLYDLCNIFEFFLPQLLTYPNPDDPLNSDAAITYIYQPDKYLKRVSDYIQRFATEDVLKRRKAEKSSTVSTSTSDDASNSRNSNSESSMSDYNDDEASSMEL